MTLASGRPTRGLPAHAHAPVPGTGAGVTSGATAVGDLAIDVIPHTHWDREWYHPFEVFRIRLVRTVEEVLAVLEADPRMTFTLDGQAAIVDDVLELRPDLRERIARRARSGQLALGPGYVQPDELLSDGETFVRNLLLGRAVVRGLGAEEMRVGYQPDVFGHAAQVPQILRGFGLDGFVFWRGLGDEVDRIGPVFRWVAPDGSWVHAIRQLDGYGGGSMLGTWTESGVRVHGPAATGEAAARRFERFVEKYASAIARGGLAHLTLANGGDHHGIQPELPALLDAARAAHPAATFRIGRYDTYLDAVRPILEASEVASVHGELLGAREAFIVRGVNSTRMPLKLAHERTQRGLGTAETLACLALLARPGSAPPYPREALGHAWRELLRNTPHDSVTGCSTDVVHRSMLDRYARADQVTSRLTAEALAGLVGAAAGWEAEPAVPEHVSLVNPLPIARRELVRLPLAPVLEGEPALVADRPSGALPVQPAGGQALVVVDLPAWGATTVALRRGSTRAAGSARAVDERTIETDCLRVRVGDGALELTDLRTGRSWSRLAWLEDTADRGDEYTYRPLDGEESWTSLGRSTVARILAAGPLVAEVEARCVARLPRRLEPGLERRSTSRVRVDIVIRARLVDGLDRLELDVRVDNRAEDHRLRIRFDDPEPAAAVRAGSPFAVVRRAPGPRSDGVGWFEIPEPTDHMAGFVAAGSLAVMAPGLPEYQAIARSDGGLDLAVTLLRCIGRLGRELPSRMGGAGPGIPTPDAQCQGPFEARLAVLPTVSTGDTILRDVDLARAAQAFATPVEPGPAGTHRPVPLAIEGDDLVFSALKAAEDGDGLILRAWNAEPVDVRARIAGAGLTAERCALDERPLPPTAAAADSIGPAAIATWRIRRG